MPQKRRFAAAGRTTRTRNSPSSRSIDIAQHGNRAERLAYAAQLKSAIIASEHV